MNAVHSRPFSQTGAIKFQPKHRNNINELHRAKYYLFPYLSIKMPVKGTNAPITSGTVITRPTVFLSILYIFISYV